MVCRKSVMGTRGLSIRWCNFIDLKGKSAKVRNLPVPFIANRRVERLRVSILDEKLQSILKPFVPKHETANYHSKLLVYNVFNCGILVLMSQRIPSSPIPERLSVLRLGSWHLLRILVPFSSTSFPVLIFDLLNHICVKFISGNLKSFSNWRS